MARNAQHRSLHMAAMTAALSWNLKMSSLRVEAGSGRGARTPMRGDFLPKNRIPPPTLANTDAKRLLSGWGKGGSNNNTQSDSLTSLSAMMKSFCGDRARQQKREGKSAGED
jgi:hypothetical protein